MLYVDTSVLVALHTREAESTGVSRWYAACADELVSAAWCVAEFTSALGIKQRTGQIGKPRLKWHGGSSSESAPATCTCCRSNPPHFIARRLCRWMSHQLCALEIPCILLPRWRRRPRAWRRSMK